LFFKYTNTRRIYNCKNKDLPAIVNLDDLNQITLVSQWCYNRILYRLREPRLIYAIHSRRGNEFLNAINDHERELWSRDLYSFLHDFYFEFNYLEPQVNPQNATGSFIHDFELKIANIWLRTDPTQRYLLNLKQNVAQLDGQLPNGDRQRLSFLLISILYYHFLLQTCYAFRIRLMGMEMIHNGEDPDGVKEEFFNHPSHLATLHSLNGHFQCPLPQNHLEITQLNNLCRKMVDLGGNNQSPQFRLRSIGLLYEALEIHDPSLSLTTSAQIVGASEIVRLDRIVNDVYRQSTLVINGFRI
jgi:hypothetical protein